MNAFGKFWKKLSTQLQRANRRKALTKGQRKSLLESLEDRRLMVTTPVKYDFGTTMSPIASGYNGSNETSVYGSIMSFGVGWNAAPSSADLGSSYSNLLRD